MQNNNNDLLREVANYYSSKLAEHGETPQGVDWNSEESQTHRFGQLSKIIKPSGQFTVNDLGCGYGAFFGYLGQHYDDFAYLGIDVSQEMIHAASLRYQDRNEARFLTSSEPDQIADYGVASGIFNVRLGRTDAEWRDYIEATLDILNQASRFGFAFNCLTSYSDSNKMRDYLYYADPCTLFDLCKRRYSRHIALLHDYGLYEFTILVRKQP
jgi:SAM-dependent methyltransferase